MHLYVELFKAKDAWLELSTEQRGGYLRQVNSSLEGVLDAGAELVGVGLRTLEPAITSVSTSTPCGSCRNADVVQMFEEGLERDDWYAYFQQVNAAGELTDFESLVRPGAVNAPLPD